MIKLALTGSIGMGKSTVADMFERAGVPVFDADAEVRALQSEGGQLVETIGKRFPGSVGNGRLDRERLARTVLQDPDELLALEMIVHPAVQAARGRFIADHRNAPAILFDIPLLLETQAEGEFDKVIVVSAPAGIQRERVLRRDGMSLEKFDAILERQMPDSEKRLRADFIIETGGDLSTTEAQVRDIIACLGIGSGG
jgi:dephospho-CoA kinase